MDNISNLCNELIEILSNKKEYLLKILDFTKLQTEAIESQDDKKLHKYIDEKQKIINRVDELNEKFIEKTNTLKSILGIESLDEIKEDNLLLKQLKTKTEEIYKVVEEILLLEKENSVKIKKEYDDIKNKLREVNGGKRLISAYNTKNTLKEGFFIDKKK